MSKASRQRSRRAITPSQSLTMQDYHHDLGIRLKAWAMEVIEGKDTLENVALACAEWHMQIAHRAHVTLPPNRSRQLYDRAYGDIAGIIATIQNGYNPEINVKTAHTLEQATMPSTRPFALKTCWGCHAVSTTTVTIGKEGRKKDYQLCDSCLNDIPTADRIMHDYDTSTTL